MICTTDLEFESRRASFIRIWNNKILTVHPNPQKYIFKDGFSRILTKKKKVIDLIIYWVIVFVKGW